MKTVYRDHENYNFGRRLYCLFVYAGSLNLPPSTVSFSRGKEKDKIIIPSMLVYLTLYDILPTLGT